MLPLGTSSVTRGGRGVVDGDPGGDERGQREGDHCLPPASGPLVSMATGVQEVAIGPAERWMAGGVGADPGGGAGRCSQQAAGVEVGPATGVAGPPGRGGGGAGSGGAGGRGGGRAGGAGPRRRGGV